MWKFKFGLWAVVLITSVFSFSACGDDDDNDTFVPPANIEVALKQLYPGCAEYRMGSERCLLCS